MGLGVKFGERVLGGLRVGKVVGLRVGLRVCPCIVGLGVKFGDRVLGGLRVGKGVGLKVCPKKVGVSVVGLVVGLRVGIPEGRGVGKGEGGKNPVTIIVPEHVELSLHPCAMMYV